MRRPIDIWIISGYFAVFGAVSLAMAFWCQGPTCFGSTYFYTGPLPHTKLFENFDLAMSNLGFVGAGLIAAVAAMCIWSLRNWARLVALGLTGFSAIEWIELVVQKLQHNRPDYVSLLWFMSDLLIINHLVRKQTRDLFIQRSSGQSSS